MTSNRYGSMRKWPRGKVAAEGASTGPVHQASSRAWRTFPEGAFCAGQTVAKRTRITSKIRRRTTAVRTLLVLAKPEHIAGKLDFLGETQVRNGQLRPQCEWENSSPDGQSVIGFLVQWRTGSNFRGCLFDHKFQDGCRFEFLFVGGAHIGPTSREQMLRNRTQGAQFPFAIFHLLRDTKSDHRTIIHRMMERGTSQHQAVDERNGNADGNTFLEFSHHSAGGRSVQVEFVAVATVQRRDHERLAAGLEADVCHKTGVQNRMNRLRVMRAAFWQATKFTALSVTHLSPGYRLRSSSPPKFCHHRRRKPAQS